MQPKQNAAIRLSSALATLNTPQTADSGRTRSFARNPPGRAAGSTRRLTGAAELASKSFPGCTTTMGTVRRGEPSKAGICGVSVRFTQRRIASFSVEMNLACQTDV
jgi:hypothetical protein